MRVGGSSVLGPMVDNDKHAEGAGWGMRKRDKERGYKE
jgi:hypothetical protein